MKARLLQLILVAELVLLGHADAQAPIYYSRYAGPPGGALAKLFALGIGTDTPVQVNLPEQAFPKISNSGRFMGVTSGDPARPSKISQNLYLIDLANNNSTRLLVENNDMVDPQSGASSTKLPLFKAFSPDGSFVAVASFVQVTGGTQGVASAPRLELFRFTDGFPVALVVLGQIRTSDYTEMAGLDWSRQQNVLVTPLRRAAPPQVQGQITALYLVDPVEDAIGTNRYTQVSFPQAGISGANRFWENDLLPAFSPDGNQIAFFRAQQSISLSGKSVSQCSLLVMNTNGSNVRPLLQAFNPGLYPTGLSWSPDGSKVIVGIAPQVISDGFPINQGDYAQSQLLIVESSGGSASNAGVVGSAFPTWSPAAATTGGPPPRLRIAPASTGSNLIIRTIGASPGMSYILESGTDLSSGWGNPQTYNGNQLNSGISVTPNLAEQYFRLRNN